MPICLGFHREYSLIHHSLWMGRVEIQEALSLGSRDVPGPANHFDEEVEERGGSISHLATLNLSHNSFCGVPDMLACLAIHLTRLNLAFNQWVLDLPYSY